MLTIRNFFERYDDFEKRRAELTVRLVTELYYKPDPLSAILKGLNAPPATPTTLGLVPYSKSTRHSGTGNTPTDDDAKRI